MEEMDIFDRFNELTTPLLSDYAKVHPKIPRLIDEIVNIRREVSEYLAKLAMRFDSDELKNICSQPSKKMVNISEQIVNFDHRIGALIVNCRGCSDCLQKWHKSNNGQLEVVSLDSRLTTEDRYICSRFDFVLRTGDPTWKYFAALPSLSLFHALESYRNLNLAFLRKNPGKRIDVSGGVNALFETRADASIDAATFNFGSALLQATNAAVASRPDKDVSNSTSPDTQIERVLQFNDALEKLDAQTHLVAAVLTLAEVSISNSISNINACGTLFTKRLIEIGGGERFLSSSAPNN